MLTIYLIAAHPSAVTSQDFHPVHFTWHLPCHTVILPLVATHTYQTEENNPKVSMLSNTATFGFDEPCLDVVESKKSQSPIEKKTCFLQKPLNHFLFTLKIVNLKFCYTSTFWFMLALSILSAIFLLFHTFFSQTSSTGSQKLPTGGIGKPAPILEL